MSGDRRNRSARSWAAALCLLAGAVAVAAATSTAPASAGVPVASSPAATSGPLTGIRIALDAGHQLGNHNFPEETSRLVPAGGFRKPCNSTGTATNAGLPEATVNFRIVRRVASRLRGMGAVVRLTRNRNSETLWGPCVNVRGRFGAKVGADLTLSVHADGAPSGDYGFHVIAPTWRYPWTSDIAHASLRLGRAIRTGFDEIGLPRSSYVGGGTALVRRSDLATLNLSDVPVVLVEVGNMRNRVDAHRMSTRRGLDRYAHALVRGIRRYLGR